jgi:hypothetical protein
MSEDAASGVPSGPLQPGETRILVQVAQDASISLELRAALEQLGHALQQETGIDDEVQGYGGCLLIEGSSQLARSINPAGMATLPAFGFSFFSR